jgi:phosphatidylinositol dimannoside acyltransferase
MYWLLKFAHFILGSIPRKAGYSLFDFFSRLAFNRSKQRKETLRRNMETVRGAPVSEEELLSVYKNYGRYYFDLFCPPDKLLQGLSGAEKNSAVVKYTEKILEQRGVIYVSLHMGNWDFGGLYMAKTFPNRVNVVVERLSPGMYKWFTKTREKWGMKVIESTDVKSMLRALKNKEILVLLADRDLEQNGPVMEFFGKNAHIPAGPATLAYAAGASIMFGSVLRDNANPLRLRVTLDPYILNPEEGPRTQEKIEQLTRMMAEKVETIIKKDPLQWCMLQEVWETAPIENGELRMEN